jgi:glycosyltransferase involved in cell wall biosynthesis
MKVKVILSAFNRPDLLPIQIGSIRKYLKNKNEIIVVHDSRNDEYVDDFAEVCDTLGVSFYHHDSISGKSPSQYHGESIQWAYDTIVKYECIDDITLILDHDMFLIEELDLIEYLGDYDIAGCHQHRGSVEYVWPGLVMFKYQSIKDIEFDFLPGMYGGQVLDTGGGTCYILQTEGIKYKPTGCEYPDSYDGIDLLDEEVNLGFGFELHLGGKFLHFRNACGWHNNLKKVANDDNKKKVLESILKDFL